MDVAAKDSSTEAPGDEVSSSVATPGGTMSESTIPLDSIFEEVYDEVAKEIESSWIHI